MSVFASMSVIASFCDRTGGAFDALTEAARLTGNGGRGGGNICCAWESGIIGTLQLDTTGADKRQSQNEPGRKRTLPE